MLILRGLLGIAVLIVLAWAMSRDRKRVPWRVVGVGLALQMLLAALILGTDIGTGGLEAARDFFLRLIGAVQPAAQMLFGDLAKGDGQFGFIFAFAGSGLIVIIFFSALMSILYHLGVMQVVIWAMAKVMAVTLGVSGAEAMAMAANVFAGQTEAPLVVRPYIEGMTLSELNAMMTGGFATIAGSVLVVYMGLIGPEIGPHLLTASLLSAPAAFVIAKIMLPERDTPTTGADFKLEIRREAHNLIEAAANGTSDGVKLYINVVAMLLAFTALINLIDWPLGEVGTWFGMEEGKLTLASIFGYVFAPIAWAIGVEGWHDCKMVGSLMGIKIAVNEFVAFLQMHSYVDNPETGFEHVRSAKIAAYILCGFANFASIGIQLGGITPLAPSRKTDLAKLAMRAMFGGALASWSTAAVAGMFIR